ncbi:MAG: sialidase-1 [Planctomycetota bacterium]|jgi:sialidase-1
MILALLACLPAQSLPLVPDRGPEPLPFFQQTDLFALGLEGVHTYRIPALCVTQAGTILAVCDARQDNSSDLPGNIDIVLRRSTDLGATWSPISTVQDLPPGHGAGDPSVLVDRVTGRIHCFYAYGPPGVGFFSSQPGSNDVFDQNTLHAHVVTSDDDGLTWSAPTDLNPQIKDPAWSALFASSGHGIQTRGGRLLQPYAVRRSNGTVSARNAYSDDHGLTWQMGSDAGLNVNESKLIELDNGAILQNMRHNSVPARFTALSIDGGVTFGPMTQDATLIDPRVNASIQRYSSVVDGDPSSLVLFTNPASTVARQNMTVRMSRDETLSWPISRAIHVGPSGYSSAVVLPDRSVGLFYERGASSSFEEITFARFNLEWITEEQRVIGANGLPNGAHPDFWAWFDAADLVGPSPSRWDDRTEAAAHHLARSTDGPFTWLQTAINGLPAASSNGNADLWGAAGVGGEFQTLPNGYTLFAVVRVNSVNGTEYVFDRATGAGGVGLRVTPSRFEIHAARSFLGSPVDAVIPSAPIDFAPHVHTIVVNGQQVTHFLDGNLSATSTIDDGGTPLVQGGLILGADFRTDRDADCEFAEVLAWKSVMSPARRAKIESYLATKYQL